MVSASSVSAHLSQYCKFMLKEMFKECPYCFPFIILYLVINLRLPNCTEKMAKWHFNVVLLCYSLFRAAISWVKQNSTRALNISSIPHELFTPAGEWPCAAAGLVIKGSDTAVDGCRKADRDPGSSLLISDILLVSGRPGGNWSMNSAPPNRITLFIWQGAAHLPEF